MKIKRRGRYLVKGMVSLALPWVMLAAGCSCSNADEIDVSKIISKKGSSGLEDLPSGALLHTRLDSGPDIKIDSRSRSGGASSSGSSPSDQSASSSEADFTVPALLPGNQSSDHLSRLVREALAIEQRSEDRATNAERAFAIYRSAASQGSLEATYHLARCFGEGIGVPRDFQKAREVMGAVIRNLGSKLNRAKAGYNPITGRRFQRYPQSPKTPTILSGFRSSSGRVYQMPKLLAVTKDGIRIMHDSGIASLQWWQVPATTQRECGYVYTDVLLVSLLGTE
jgi:hypothetical protein